MCTFGDKLTRIHLSGLGVRALSTETITGMLYVYRNLSGWGGDGF